MQIDKSNTQLKLTVSDLRLKLRTKDKEMHKEMQKVCTYITLDFYTTATCYMIIHMLYMLLFQL